MPNGYVVDTLTSVDIQEFLIIGSEVIEIYEGVIYRHNFKVGPFRKVIDKLFALRQKYKKKNNDVMQLLVKMLKNSLYGEQISKDIDEKLACEAEAWMMTECDELKNIGKYQVLTILLK